MRNDPKFDIENDGGHMVWKQPAKRADAEIRYDWEGFYLEVVRFMQGLKESTSDAATLQDHMRHWCLLTWRRCPTEALLLDKLERVCSG
jgi:hypothetical protein